MIGLDWIEYLTLQRYFEEKQLGTVKASMRIKIRFLTNADHKLRFRELHRDV